MFQQYPEPSVDPVLISVTIDVSFESGSVSLVNTSFSESFVTVKVEVAAISIVLLSLTPTGASLAPVTVIVSCPVSVPPLPSETVYVK